MPAFITNHLDWIVSFGIVVLGLFVYGAADLLRSRPGRVWAIGGVCFRDAIRRRVLWITPMAMLGIILISQFQKPLDEQDAVRLTIKVCLFTTGLVVTIIALVTAATNLPREIDNRVIFTIVTKPVTRLEIVVGKIVGFARVSAVMLLVMGLFTLLYLHTQSWWLTHGIGQALESGSTESSRRVWLEHVRDQGLLQARSVVLPSTMQQFARPPEDEDGGFLIGGSQDALVRLPLQPDSLVSPMAPGTPGGAGFLVALKIGYEPVHAPAAAATRPTAGPNVTVQIVEPSTGSVIISADQLGKTSTVGLTDAAGTMPVYVQVPPERATQLAQLPALGVQVICPDAEYLYRLRGNSVSIVVPDSDKAGHAVPIETAMLLRGSTSRGVQQLAGPGRGVQPVAVYGFRGAPSPGTIDGRRVSFEMTVGVESNGDTSEREPVGTLEVRAVDRNSGKTSEPFVVYPENRRTVFFELPHDFVSGGKFDLLLRNTSSGHTIGLGRISLAMVAGREYFGLNLLKALVVIWLLSVLAAAVAFCCSTFLSWPIAVVLSTLIILGHWAVSNVDLGSGIGAAVANDFVGANAPVARVVNTSVENLSRVLLLVGGVLPDISAFGITDRIERGASLTLADMAEPAGVLVLFGLPLLTLAYVFLRNKEVAP